MLSCDGVFYAENRSSSYGTVKKIRTELCYPVMFFYLKFVDEILKSEHSNETPKCFFWGAFIVLYNLVLTFANLCL